MIYFTADTHFGHKNIINLSRRPFTDLGNMHETLILNWNACVREEDEVYILGDFCYKADAGQVNQILRHLNGTKYLIIGNHDVYIDDPDFDRSAFGWIRHYHVLDYLGRKFVLFHYPILEWQGFFRGAIHLYGHVHNCLKDSEQEKRLAILGAHAVNVGVDVHGYYPVGIDAILKRVGAAYDADGL